jgi:vacuolar-type H+-ATPase subunit C/Vma6
MERSGASAFVYAKASGMLAKSFIGKRSLRLFEANTLHELWSLLFAMEAPVVPEAMLAKALEQQAEKQFADDYITLLRVYSDPDPILVMLLRTFDYDNLKDIGAALCDSSETCPELVDIRPYSELNYGAWPDIAKITRASPSASWYNTVPLASDQHELDTKLDKQYALELWKSVCSLAKADKEAVYDIIQQQIVFQNIQWAIRLKVYFAMPKEEIIPRLTFASSDETKNDPLAGEAFRILDWPVDTYDAWAKWKYANLLNPSEEGVPWTIDPRWMNQAFKKQIQRRALLRFHQHPFTDATLVMWFLIKQFELDCIRTAVEGLRLNVDKQRVREAAGVQE